MCSIDGQISFMGTALWNQGHRLPSAHQVNLEFNADANLMNISHIKQGAQLMAGGQHCQLNWNRIGIGTTLKEVSSSTFNTVPER